MAYSILLAQPSLHGATFDTRTLQLHSKLRGTRCAGVVVMREEVWGGREVWTSRALYLDAEQG